MIKKFIIILSILITINSCNLLQKGNENIVQPKEFIDLLIDIHIADAILSVESNKITKDTIKVNLFYDDVLKKHNVSRAKLKQTIDFYTEHPKEYNKIYEQVLETLSEKQQELKKEKEQRQEPTLNPKK